MDIKTPEEPNYRRGPGKLKFVNSGVTQKKGFLQLKQEILDDCDPLGEGPPAKKFREPEKQEKRVETPFEQEIRTFMENTGKLFHLFMISTLTTDF